MFSDDNTPTTDADLPTRRVGLLAIVAIVAVVAIVTASSGAAVAQSQPQPAQNASAQNASVQNESTIIHDFAESDVILRDIRFDDNHAYVKVESESIEPVTVSDAGFEGSGQFSVKSVHVQGEETIKIRYRDDEIVAVSTPQDGYQYEGDVSLLTIIQNAPTTELVQWAAISGMVGVILDLSGVVTLLRRKHENTYKELTSEESIKVQKDPVDGFVDKFKRFVSENRFVVVTSLLLLVYLMFWAVGRVPSPIGIWEGMTDAMRVLVAGSLMMSIVGLVPVYVLAKRLWEPSREFVFSADARDVLEESLGSDGGLAEVVEAVEERGGLVDEDGEPIDFGEYAVSVYSGAPERIADMEIDGAATESRVPGGPCHFVQGFNPAENVARGTWPGTADDLELIAERSKIDGNREILRDESRMLRSLLSAMPAIATSADTHAAKSVDSELRNLMSIDGSPVNNILGRAAAGTRFEGFYGDDGDNTTVEYDEQGDEKETEKSAQ